jgi:hypothetical protein
LESSPQRIKAENDSHIDIFPATPPSQLPNDAADRYSKELLRKAERLCRDRRVHAVSRLEKLELWLFEPAEGSAIGQGKGAEDPSKVDINVVATEGLKFQSKHSLPYLTLDSRQLLITIHRRRNLIGNLPLIHARKEDAYSYPSQDPNLR